jgi:hypothetical protein
LAQVLLLDLDIQVARHILSILALSWLLVEQVGKLELLVKQAQ